jgi:hypothetical protein
MILNRLALFITSNNGSFQLNALGLVSFKAYRGQHKKLNKVDITKKLCQTAYLYKIKLL